MTMAATGRVRKPKPTKYYGKCMSSTGKEIVLVAKAYSEIEACEQLHRNYTIIMVLDLITSEEVEARKNSRRGSRVGVPTLL